MEKAKFVFKYDKMLPISFDNYLLKLEKAHKFNTTGKKSVMSTFKFILEQSREKSTSSSLFKSMEGDSP